MMGAASARVAAASVRCILRLAVQLELDLPHSTRRGSDSRRLCQSVHFSTWSLRAVRSKELVEGLLSRHPLEGGTSWCQRETPKTTRLRAGLAQASAPSHFAPCSP